MVINIQIKTKRVDTKPRLGPWPSSPFANNLPAASLTTLTIACRNLSASVMAELICLLRVWRKSIEYFLSSAADRQTDRNFAKYPFLSSKDSKTDIPTKSSKPLSFRPLYFVYTVGPTIFIAYIYKGRNGILIMFIHTQF